MRHFYERKKIFIGSVFTIYKEEKLRLWLRLVAKAFDAKRITKCHQWLHHLKFFICVNSVRISATVSILELVDVLLQLV